MANYHNNHAFPWEVDVDRYSSDDRYIKNIEKGLSKREYFAAKALQGILSIQKISGIDDIYIDYCAEKSIAIADKLIEKLNEK